MRGVQELRDSHPQNESFPLEMFLPLTTRGRPCFILHKRNTLEKAACGHCDGTKNDRLLQMGLQLSLVSSQFPERKLEVCEPFTREFFSWLDLGAPMASGWVVAPVHWPCLSEVRACQWGRRGIPKMASPSLYSKIIFLFATSGLMFVIEWNTHKSSLNTTHSS